MRLVTYNIDSELVNKIQDDDLYIVDVAEDLNDLLYHLSVRFYNLVLIHSNSLKNCINALQEVFNSNTAFVILTDDLSVNFELKCFKNGAYEVLQYPVDKELLMARLEAIHRDNFNKSIKHKDYFRLKKEDKKVVDLNDNELHIRGKAYDVLRYLVQNKHRPPISKDELICTIWEDPEMVCQNVIEVNVNLIRVQLKKHLNIDLIETVRNRGYKIKG
jgi:DNA-binding response OmpR family regulator